MKLAGYARVANGNPSLRLGDINYNTKKIIELFNEASNQNIDLLVLPELCITGYSLGDMFHQSTIIEASQHALSEIALHAESKRTILIVGLPFVIDDSLYNVAAVIHYGEVLGLVPKTYLPCYNEFYETRWFASATMLQSKTCLINGKLVPIGTDLIFSNIAQPNFTFGIEICEDLWAPIPPSSLLALSGAHIVANLSASNELIGKSDYRKDLVKSQSARTLSAYVYTSAGPLESSTDVVYGGHSLIAENGLLLKESKRFSLDASLQFADIDLEKLVFERLHSNTFRESKKVFYNQPPRKINFTQALLNRALERYIDPHPFVPSNDKERSTRCEEIVNIQTLGLAKRLMHIGHPTSIIGVSGGLDSTLALLVTVKTYDILKQDRKNIIGVTMPGFGTTDRTYFNAIKLMENLGITLLDIPITDSVLQHFKDIDHDPTLHNITYENSQARERTQILMDLANKYNGIVIGTGDLSELALGWATYNGDHMSMYGVNASIPKTLVRYVVQWFSESEANDQVKAILSDVLQTPVSPELLPPSHDGTIAQKTEEVVGPYELHDFFLYNMLRFGYSPRKIFYLAEIAFSNTYSSEIIHQWITLFYKRFFSQQFKRSALPDGPKVGSINLSPRGDLRMPSDLNSVDWLRNLEELPIS